ncbi:ATP-binding protein [Xanthomonas oryzae pv. oryzicola]|uniref:ATP-binding protein n=1 Tax=Xanthomonas oryzae TaxID=347 RepID=UPI003D166769
MSRGVIWNRGQAFAYAKWLDRRASDFLLISEVDRADAGAFGAFIKLDSLDSCPTLEQTSRDWLGDMGPRVLFAHSEKDLERAAAARSWLGLEGQSLESATAFKDKHAMKAHARISKVATASHRKVRYPSDLSHFVEEFGYPVVVKPVDGSGSRGVEVIEGEAALRSFCERRWPWPPTLVESFVRGSMFHADGVAVDGQLRAFSVSEYLNGCLAYQHAEPLGSTLRDESEPIVTALRDELAKILAGFPRTRVLPFHAEFFVGDDGAATLCEIASRTGGARVVDTVAAFRGINLNELWFKCELGIEPPLAPHEPASSGGWVLIPPSPGRVVSMPGECPFPWVVDYSAKVASGDVVKPAVASIDYVASFVVRGAHARETRTRLGTLVEWFMGEYRVEPLASAT